MNTLTVFCASSSGHRPAYVQAAREVGRFLAAHRITLVYGGGNVGLMGTLADAVLQAGGRAIGVIPRFLLDLEVGHRGLTELIVVDSIFNDDVERLYEKMSSFEPVMTTKWVGRDADKT